MDREKLARVEKLYAQVGGYEFLVTEDMDELAMWCPKHTDGRWIEEALLAILFGFVED